MKVSKELRDQLENQYAHTRATVRQAMNDLRERKIIVAFERLDNLTGWINQWEKQTLKGK